MTDTTPKILRLPNIRLHLNRSKMLTCVCVCVRARACMSLDFFQKSSNSCASLLTWRFEGSRSMSVWQAPQLILHHDAFTWAGNVHPSTSTRRVAHQGSIHLADKERESLVAQNRTDARASKRKSSKSPPEPLYWVVQPAGLVFVNHHCS